MLKRVVSLCVSAVLAVALFAPTAFSQSATYKKVDMFLGIEGNENMSYNNIEVTQQGYQNPYDSEFFDKTYVATAPRGARASVVYTYPRIDAVEMVVYGAGNTKLTESGFLSCISPSAGTKRISNVEFGEGNTTLSATVHIENIKAEKLTITITDAVKMKTNYIQVTENYDTDTKDPDKKNPDDSTSGSTKKKTPTKKKSSTGSSSRSGGGASSSGSSSDTASSAAPDSETEAKGEDSVVAVKRDNGALLYIGGFLGLVLLGYIAKLLMDFLKKKKEDGKGGDDPGAKGTDSVSPTADSEEIEEVKGQDNDLDIFRQKQMAQNLKNSHGTTASGQGKEAKDGETPTQ